MTYFSKNLSKAKRWEKEAVLQALREDYKSGNYWSTIQWNPNDSLYGVSSLEEMPNTSDGGYIWHYERTVDLLHEIEAQL